MDIGSGKMYINYFGDCMRIIYIALILMFSSLSNAEEPLRAGLTCEIKKQWVVDMVEGEPKSYSGVKDGLDDGDIININFKLFGEALKVSLANIDKNFDLKLSNEYALSRPFQLKNIESNLGKILIIKPDIKYAIDDDTIIHIKKNYLYINTSHSNFSLTRYYKDDWSGTVLLTANRHILGVNCTMDGYYNKILEKITEACFSIDECKEEYIKYSDVNI
jgi:hypothetical protein